MPRIWLLGALLWCACLAACPKSEPKEDPAAVAKELAIKLAQSPTPPELGQARLDLAFSNAKPGSGKALVDLSFAVTDTADNVVKPRLNDPKNPEAASIKADGWKYTVTPRLGQNGQSNGMLNEAFVRGYYCVDVYTPSGERAGHFDVLNTGNLMYKGQTELTGVNVEPVTYGDRTVFLLWGAAAPDGMRQLELGLEWQKGKFPGQFDVKAQDGWTYDVEFPQGTLHAYQPSQLKDWPDEFRILALGEQALKAEYHDKRLAELAEAQKTRNCGG